MTVSTRFLESLCADILGAAPAPRDEADPPPRRPTEWRDPQSYAYTATLARDAWAWEFLRRHPDYRAAWARCVRMSGRAGPGFGLVTLEDPQRTATQARCLWQPAASSFVLPLRAERCGIAADAVLQDLSPLQARAAAHLGEGLVQHVLFAEEGRCLQLAVHGEALFGSVCLSTDGLLAPGGFTRRVLLLKRLSAFIADGHLPPTLYPPEPRARRLAILLRALDGWLARASHREIADVIFERDDVAAEWARSARTMKQAARRAVGSGRGFMQGGYLSLLK